LRDKAWDISYAGSNNAVLDEGSRSVADIISIIIPTWNAGKRFPELLEALKLQTVSCEITVVDSSSSDGTEVVAKAHGAKTILIDKKDFDHGGTRNLGVRSSAGDYLIFMTQDVLPANERVVENLLRPLQDPDVALCYGRQVAREDAAPLERFARAFNYPEKAEVKGRDHIRSMGIKTFFFSDACSAARRKEFEEFGGFPEKTIMNEDMLLASKMILTGYKVAYEPSAVVYHSHHYSLNEQFGRYFDIGVALGRNRWMLDLVPPAGEGMRFLREQTSFLAREKEWALIPYGYLEAALKYLAFRLGLSEGKIPRRLKAGLSRNKDFWRR
jgi:GT2 family glycosyltransferase